MRRGVAIEKDQMLLHQKENKEKKKNQSCQGAVTTEANLAESNGTGPPGGKLPNPRKVWQLRGVGKCGWQCV